ncbi:MAG TPA: class I SAM-dependent methyltransferase [candidate division Zixibacteria bacterium]|nr:class I SAM-dependent methyltransferase [candidate division Zixibacteria bacterium]
MTDPAASPFDRAEAYDRYMGRWSRLIAARFLDWLAVPSGAAWLDVGCGTGALLGTIAATRAPGRLTGIDQSAQYAAVARQRVPGAEVLVGDAQALPFAADSFDACVSGLVLNFVPQPALAVAGMCHATRPGGVVGVYVWDYAEGMQLLRSFWDVVTELDPAANALDEGSKRFSIAHPEALESLFTTAGLGSVATTAVEVPAPFASFDDYWRPFLGGQGPAGGYLVALPEERQATVAAALRERLPLRVDGSFDLTLRAWAVRGTVS